MQTVINNQASKAKQATVSASKPLSPIYFRDDAQNNKQRTRVYFVNSQGVVHFHNYKLDK